MTITIAFIVGFVFGAVFMAFACFAKSQTHDLTIIDGRTRWVDRNDRALMTYDELKEKYK